MVVCVRRESSPAQRGECVGVGIQPGKLLVPVERQRREGQQWLVREA